MHICIHAYMRTYVHTLHYTTLHYITLHYTTLHYIALHCTTLHYITLHYTSLHYITLHYTTLHYITLHYTTLQFTVYKLHVHLHSHVHSHLLLHLHLHCIALHYINTAHYNPGYWLVDTASPNNCRQVTEVKSLNNIFLKKWVCDVINLSEHLKSCESTFKSYTFVGLMGDEREYLQGVDFVSIGSCCSLFHSVLRFPFYVSPHIPFLFFLSVFVGNLGTWFRLAATAVIKFPALNTMRYVFQNSCAAWKHFSPRKLWQLNWTRFNWKV